MFIVLSNCYWIKWKLNELTQAKGSEKFLAHGEYLMISGQSYFHRAQAATSPPAPQTHSPWELRVMGEVGTQLLSIPYVAGLGCAFTCSLMQSCPQPCEARMNLCLFYKGRNQVSERSNLPRITQQLGCERGFV